MGPKWQEIKHQREPASIQIIRRLDCALTVKCPSSDNLRLFEV